MAKLIPLIALASMITYQGYAQNCCPTPTPPTVIKIHADGTTSVMINIPSTQMYINPSGGGVSTLPCGTMVTFDHTPPTMTTQASVFPTMTEDTTMESKPPKTESIKKVKKEKKPRVKKRLFYIEKKGDKKQ